MSEVNKVQPLPVTQDAPIGLEGAPETGSRAAGLVAGMATAFVCAIIGTIVMVQFALPIDYPVIGTGFLIALAVRKVGGGNTPPFALVGALCALAGSFLSEVFLAAGLHAQKEGVSGLLAVAQMLDDSQLAASLLQKSFNPMSLICHAVALFEGYKLSRRPKW